MNKTYRHRKRTYRGPEVYRIGIQLLSGALELRTTSMSSKEVAETLYREILETYHADVTLYLRNSQGWSMIATSAAEPFLHPDHHPRHLRGVAYRKELSNC